jgi:hypothetical protein
MSEATLATINPDAATKRFELAQREAKGLAASGLVPKAYENNIANCLLAFNISLRLGCDPFTVMQNLDIIHGRPSWRAQFLVATFNGCGKFTSIKYRFDGEKDEYGCTAYATEISTGDKIEGPKVTWKMVKAEGWLDKNGSKWKTMPDLMFRYRAAAFLVRTTAPEISMGFGTREEADDYIEAKATPVRVEQVRDLLAAPPADNSGPSDADKNDPLYWDEPAFMAELNAAKSAAEIGEIGKRWDQIVPHELRGFVAGIVSERQTLKGGA